MPKDLLGDIRIYLKFHGKVKPFPCKMQILLFGDDSTVQVQVRQLALDSACASVDERMCPSVGHCKANTKT